MPTFLSFDLRFVFMCVLCTGSKRAPGYAKGFPDLDPQGKESPPPAWDSPVTPLNGQLLTLDSITGVLRCMMHDYNLCRLLFPDIFAYIYTVYRCVFSRNFSHFV